MRYQIKLYKESNRILCNIVQGIPEPGIPVLILPVFLCFISLYPIWNADCLPISFCSELGDYFIYDIDPVFGRISIVNQFDLDGSIQCQVTE